MTETSVNKLRIAYMASGAAGMYCGSCLRDNRLAATLLEQGRDVVLMPLYTPLRTDEHDVSTSPVRYGGLNVYLQQKSTLFRRLPRSLSQLLDSPRVLGMLSRWSGSVDAKSLGPLTVSVLQGEHGAQAGELEKLVEALAQIRPHVVHLPTLPFAGVARRLKEALGVPVFCTLSGEDIFLDDLPEPYRARSFELIRKAGSFVDVFVATSQYYASHCIEHFGLEPHKVHHVPMGIRVEDFAPAEPDRNRPFTIGYLARVCPEKGLDILADAFSLLRHEGRTCRLRIAGYVAPSQRKYVGRVMESLGQHASGGHVDFLGEVARAEKVNFLQSLDVLCVPSRYPEAKGLYVLEALACGVSVVLPGHGSFPELVRASGGGMLYDPTVDVRGLAKALAQVMDQPQERQRMGLLGRSAAIENFNDRVMAQRTWELYEKHATSR